MKNNKNNDKNRPTLEINAKEDGTDHSKKNIGEIVKKLLEKFYQNIVNRKIVAIASLAVAVAVLFVFLSFILGDVFLSQQSTILTVPQGLEQNTRQKNELQLEKIKKQVENQEKRISDIEELYTQNRNLLQNLDARFEEALRKLLNTPANDQSRVSKELQSIVQQITQLRGSQIELQKNIGNYDDNKTKDHQSLFENITGRLQKIEQLNQNNEMQDWVGFMHFYLLHNEINNRVINGQPYYEVLSRYLQYIPKSQSYGSLDYGSFGEFLDKYARQGTQQLLGLLDNINESELKSNRQTTVNNGETPKNNAGIYNWLQDYSKKFIEIRKKNPALKQKHELVKIMKNVEIAIITKKFTKAYQIIQQNDIENLIEKKIWQAIIQLMQVQKQLEQIYEIKLTQFLNHNHQ